MRLLTVQGFHDRIADVNDRARGTRDASEDLVKTCFEVLAALDLALDYHFAPAARVDPWLERASGYRVLWLVPIGDAIADPKLSTFVFAALQGRIDLGGSRLTQPRLGAARGMQAPSRGGIERCPSRNRCDRTRRSSVSCSRLRSPRSRWWSR